MNLFYCLFGGLALSVGCGFLAAKFIGWGVGDYPTPDIRLHEDDTQ